MNKFIYIFLTICIVLSIIITNEILDITKGKKDWDIKLVSESLCDLQSSECEFHHLKQKGVIRFIETPVLINKTHILQVDIDIKTGAELWVDFKGVEIDMGHNRVQLRRNGKFFEGKVYLPSCSLNEMTWKAMLIINSGDKMLGHVYKFKTVKNYEN